MSRKCFFSLLMMLAMQAAVLSVAQATDCSDTAYGVSTMRGDAQYPPGWLDDVSPIEISRPDEFVYGVIDGTVLPQQFLHIKAKLRNRMERQIMAGTLRAAARYRKRVDYQPDLTADPPTADSREEVFSASLSLPIAIDGLASDTPQSFTFDFSDDPIPAGITDLILIVTFQGEVEGVDEPLFVFGIKDLNEPTHFAIWNLRDYYAFWGEPRSVTSILNNQADYDQVVETCPTSPDIFLREDLIFTSVYIGFHSESGQDPVFTVEYSDLHPGRYGRIIVLLDVGQDDPFYLYRENHYAGGCTVGNYDPSVPLDPFADCAPAWSLKEGAAVYQQNNQGFRASDMRTTRQTIRTHELSGHIGYCPWDGYFETAWTLLHQQIPPANDAPVGAAAINFP